MKERETCQSGRHPWIPENIYTRPDGRHCCRPCRAEISRKRNALERARARELQRVRVEARARELQRVRVEARKQEKPLGAEVNRHMYLVAGACPRCHGAVRHDSDGYGEFKLCLNCGWAA